MSKGSFPEMLSQRILVGMIFGGEIPRCLLRGEPERHLMSSPSRTGPSRSLAREQFKTLLHPSESKPRRTTLTPSNQDKSNQVWTSEVPHPSCLEGWTEARVHPDGESLAKIREWTGHERKLAQGAASPPEARPGHPLVFVPNVPHAGHLRDGPACRYIVVEARSLSSPQRRVHMSACLVMLTVALHSRLAHRAHDASRPARSAPACFLDRVNRRTADGQFP
jgi:hypothetical protein